MDGAKPLTLRLDNSALAILRQMAPTRADGRLSQAGKILSQLLHAEAARREERARRQARG